MYIIIKTPCWPAQWKVAHKNWPNFDNSISNFFRNLKDAKLEADRRNR